MAIKHILLPMPDGTNDAAVCALELARRLAAHVTAGYFEYLDPYVFSVEPGVPYAGYSLLYGEILRLRDERSAAARNAFDRAVATTKVEIVRNPACAPGTAHWLENDDRNPIAIYGGVVDLIVAAAPSQRGLPDLGAIIQKGLFAARRPVLVVPAGCNNIDLRRPVIAWNGSPQAANAVRCALDLLPLDCKMTVLQAGKTRPGFCPAERLLETLGWHCFSAKLEQLMDHPHQTGERLLSEAATLGATMLVMGAYTHSRAREELMGGVTKYMLQQSTLPLLLCH